MRVSVLTRRSISSNLTFYRYDYKVIFQCVLNCFCPQKMGVVMRAAVKSQINLVMGKVEGVRQLAGVRDMIYPILWLHDGVDSMEVNTVF